MVSKSKKQKVSASAAKLKASPHLAAKLESVDSSNRSPVIAAAFAPQVFHLDLFASVIRGLDAQRLRIHDCQTLRLNSEHVFEKGVEVNSLSWGSLADDGDQKKKKKRKRRRESKTNGLINGDGGHDGDDKDDDAEEDEHDNSGTVVAAAASNGNIYLYSLVQGAMSKVLQGGHVGNVHDFRFTEHGKKLRGWSCGSDSLVEWDLKKGAILRTFILPKSYGSPNRILPTSQNILCASHSIYKFDIENPSQSHPPVASHASLVHSLLHSKNRPNIMSAAQGDRFVNVSDLTTGTLLGSLVARSDVEHMSIDPTESAVAIVNAEGIVEVFEKVWSHTPQAAEGDAETMAKRKKPSTRTSCARINVVKDNKEIVKIVSVGFQRDDIVVGFVQNGTNVYFARVKWEGETSDQLGIRGDIELLQKHIVGMGVKDPAGSQINGVKDVSKVNIDQANAVVVDGLDTEDVGMVDAGDLAVSSADKALLGTEEDAMDEDLAASSGDDEEEDEKDDVQEPSFAEKFQQLEVRTGTESSMDQSNSIVSSKSGTATTTITVPSIGDTTKALQTSNHSQFLTATSLTTVLSQALKTSDRALLETCFHTTNPSIITATISRLDSVLAVTLITKLAELISRKPGRAGSLMIWVETTFIYHGGHLLTLPDLISRLASLQRVLGRRSASLTKMLALRGRLRMLVAQMKLRSTSRSANPDDDNEAVVYVEGVNDDEESDEEDPVALIKGVEDEDIDGLGDSDSASDEEDEEVQGINGVLESADEDLGHEDDDEQDAELSDEEEEEDEDADDVGRYLDDEAEEDSEEESENDSFVVSDDEVEYDEESDGFLDDDEDDEEPAPKDKKNKSAGLSKGKLSKGSK